MKRFPRTKYLLSALAIFHIQKCAPKFARIKCVCESTQNQDWQVLIQNAAAGAALESWKSNLQNRKQPLNEQPERDLITGQKNWPREGNVCCALYNAGRARTRERCSGRPSTHTNSHRERHIFNIARDILARYTILYAHTQNIMKGHASGWRGPCFIVLSSERKITHKHKTLALVLLIKE
jgi:hypothetical protein